MINQFSDFEINHGEIHLWFALLDEIKDEIVLSDYEKLLTSDEQVQRQRFHFEKHRRQYLVTRALVRTTLSRYADVDPSDWRFSKNNYGKPEIVPPPGIPPLRFNLSHTDGLVICGIVLKQDIGVDVEDVRREKISINIADRYFSSQEVKDLYKVPESERQHLFFKYWTLKESFVKALGMGLSLPLDQFAFHLSEKEPLRISFGPLQNANSKNWRFWLVKPSMRHIAAVSVNGEDGVIYQLSMKKVIPLKEEKPFLCRTIVG